MPLTFDGSIWAQGYVRDPDGLLRSISCPTLTFCVAVDLAGRAIVHTASGWSAPRRIDRTGNALSAVDCTGPDFCVAVDTAGYAVTWTGEAWRAPRLIEERAVLTDVSCSRPGYCAAVSAQGDAIRLVDGSWLPAEVVAPAVGEPTTVSCASSTLCVSLDASAARTSFTGSGWTIPTRVVQGSAYGFTGISCFRTDECMGVNANGYAQLVSPTGAFGAPHDAVTPGDRLAGVSCVSQTFCIAVSDGGSAAAYDGFNWHSEAVVSPKFRPTGVSCVPGLCVATTTDGPILLRRGGSWSRPIVPAGSAVLSASCASTTFCMATTYGNRALRYDGSSWHQVSDQSIPRMAISCASATLCAAVGKHSAAMWDGTSWTATEQIIRATDAALVSVSCQSAICAAVDPRGRAVVAI